MLIIVKRIRQQDLVRIFLLFGREPCLGMINILEGGRKQIGKGSYHETISNWREAMDEAHKIAFERSKRSKHRENILDFTALGVGDRVLGKNKKEQLDPGKLRSFWEQEIYIIRSVKDEAGVIFGVIQEGNLRGKSRVLHRISFFRANS